MCIQSQQRQREKWSQTVAPTRFARAVGLWLFCLKPKRPPKTASFSGLLGGAGRGSSLSEAIEHSRDPQSTRTAFADTAQRKSGRPLMGRYSWSTA